jgi:hypothetical protein
LPVESSATRGREHFDVSEADRSAPTRLGFQQIALAEDHLSCCDVGGAAPDVLPRHTGDMMRMRCPSACSVSSTMTTASAPSGMGAPVAISMHSPRAIGREAISPV